MRNDVFERLFAEHAEPLLAFLVYRTGDRALSEDLVADTFERALRARKRFDRRRASEKTWLYTIALNLLRDRARRAAIERRVLAAAPAREAAESVEFEAVAERDVVQRALERLTPEERDAIALRYGGDLTVPEIAKLTKESLTTVEGRVYRALRKMRDELS